MRDILLVVMLILLVAIINELGTIAKNVHGMCLSVSTTAPERCPAEFIKDVSHG